MAHFRLPALLIFLAGVGPYSIFAQQQPEGSQDLISEEDIEQSKNRGIEIWEGTLFGQDSYKPGSYAQIEALPNPGFEFDKWEGERVADTTQAKTFVTMEDHLDIKPHFRRIWNVIATPDNKEAGNVTGGGDYPDGTEVNLKVQPNLGFEFLGWEGKGIREEEKEELETSIIVEGDHDIVARFENQDQNENQDQENDQNEDQSDQNQDQENDQNEDQSDQNQDQQDPGEQEKESQEPESKEDEPQEPEENETDQEEQPESPEEVEGQETPPEEAYAPEGQPVPLQMTPEEAIRLLEAMEDDEKKLPLFIVTPPDPKKDPKKDW